MKFLVDQNLPAALAAWLRERGFEAQHALEAGLSTENDADIIRIARGQGWVVVTQDSDYLDAAGGNPAFWLQVVWVRLGNTATANLLARWAADWDRIRAELEAGQELIEIR